MYTYLSAAGRAAESANICYVAAVGIVLHGIRGYLLTCFCIFLRIIIFRLINGLK